MRFGSICSGIEAASTAWHPLGWQTVYVSDIEPFPCAVLAQRVGAGRPKYMPDPNEAGLDEDSRKERRAAIKAVAHLPEVGAIPNYGDFTRIADEPDAPEPELIVGGTPCQAFSVAGARQSLADARGNLTLEFVRLVHASKSLRWAVWENVPGVLSTEDNAFGCFLGGLVGANDPVCVPGGGRWTDSGMVSGPLGRAAWRIFDAQHFGLAQRRRRVFVVFCPRTSGGDPVAILLERKGMPWDFAPGAQARKGVAVGAGEGVGSEGEHCHRLAPTLTSSGRGVSRPGETRGQGPVVAIDCAPDGIAETVTSKWHKGTGGPAGDEHYNMVVQPTDIAHTLRAEGFDASEDGTGRGTPLVACAPIAFSGKDYGADATEDLAPTLRAGGHVGSHANGGVGPAIAFAQNSRDELRAIGGEGDIVGALAAQPGMKQQTFLAVPSAVRRLTPRECERLQGFPDDHTLITWKGKPAADGPRYKALGNSMAVPVMRWIGERIAAYEAGTLDTWAPAFLYEERRPGGGGVAIPITQDALRGEGTALTPSADAEGRVRLRDPGFGVGKEGDPAGTLTAASPGAVAVLS